jgi:hypothetical protein
MKTKLLLLTLIFNSNLLSANIKNLQQDYCKMAYNGMNAFSKSLETNDDLHLEGRGGAMMHDIKTINLTYSTEKYLNINQSRKLIISTSQKLINFFNSYTEIQPFLHDIPFTEKNIDLMISFKKNGKRIHHKYITLVFTKNSKIFYCEYDNENKRFIDVLEETYAEGLQKLAEENH